MKYSGRRADRMIRKNIYLHLYNVGGGGGGDSDVKILHQSRMAVLEPTPPFFLYIVKFYLNKSNLNCRKFDDN